MKYTKQIIRTKTLERLQDKLTRKFTSQLAELDSATKKKEVAQLIAENATENCNSLRDFKLRTHHIELGFESYNAKSDLCTKLQRS
jgi:hypothetical protein